MSVNTELIGKVLQSIQDHPFEHVQNYWLDWTRVSGGSVFGLEDLKHDCGTAACAAGWTLLHEGYQFRVIPYDEMDPIRPHRIQALKDGKVLPEGSIPETAAERISDDSDIDFHQLFYDLNEERAKAQLMFLYENGHLPEMTDWSGDELSVDDLQDEGGFIGGKRWEDFVDEWVAILNDTFPPS